MTKMSKKPLHVYEQSLLLAALLFAHKNIDEILSFLPSDQIERITEAKSRFLRFEPSDRIAKIILELRRLLLYSQRKIGWIHQSWIDDALEKEPGYLKPLIKDLLRSNQEGEKIASASPSHAIAPSVIFHSFLNQFETTQKKVAIFDPILMRLHSLKDADQDKTFAHIGMQALRLIKKKLDEKRLIKFIKITPPSDPDPLSKNDPFADQNLKTLALRHLISLQRQAELDLEVELGLFIVALHLSDHSKNWLATTALILKKPLGRRLLALAKTTSPNALTGAQHELIREMLLGSIEFDAI